MPELLWRMMNGIYQEPKIECQTATAAKDKTGPRTDKLMEEVLRRENLLRALKRVQRNKGAPGVDGMIELEGRNTVVFRPAPTFRDTLTRALPPPARWAGEDE